MPLPKTSSPSCRCVRCYHVHITSYIQDWCMPATKHHDTNQVVHVGYEAPRLVHEAHGDTRGQDTSVYKRNQMTPSAFARTSPGPDMSAINTTQVNSRFQETPLQDIATFYQQITVPGVGPVTAAKLCECNIQTPSALVGHFMVCVPITHHTHCFELSYGYGSRSSVAFTKQNHTPHTHTDSGVRQGQDEVVVGGHCWYSPTGGR